MMKAFWAVLPLTLILSNSTRASADPHKESSTKEESAHHKPTIMDPKSTTSSEGQKLIQKSNCEKMPQNTTSEMWEVASCYQEINDYDESIRTLKSLNKLNPRDLQAFFTASWLLTVKADRAIGNEEKKYLLDALEELQRAKITNLSHWEVYIELGDFYYMKAKPRAYDKAYKAYQDAKERIEGSLAQGIPAASVGQKAGLENRIARAALKLGRTGEAVEASCRALYYDADDGSALKRITKLNGSCKKKGVKDPTKKDAEPAHH